MTCLDEEIKREIEIEELKKIFQIIK